MTSTASDAGTTRARNPITPVMVMLAAMWGSEVADVPLDGRLDRFGIRPRQMDGIDGIVLSPFLHGGFAHLVANTIPFVVLGGIIALTSGRRFIRVTMIVGLVAGIGTWLTGQSGTVHIGASGLVFGYLSYLITRGVFARSIGYLAIGVVVAALYGGVLWGVLPQPGISWQGHLFGVLGGVAAASLLHGRSAQVGGVRTTHD